MLNKLMQKNIFYLSNTCIKSFSNISEKYYTKEFTNKLEFNEPTKIMPLFRVMDLKGNIINKKY